MSKASSIPAAGKNRGIVWPTARRPAWISEEEIEFLPIASRQEAVELVASMYQELVVEAGGPLERAAGEEFVFLFWLGLVRSVRLRGHSLPGQPLVFGNHPEHEIQNYLQLGLARQRVANLKRRPIGMPVRQSRKGSSVAQHRTAPFATVSVLTAALARREPDPIAERLSRVSSSPARDNELENRKPEGQNGIAP